MTSDGAERKHIPLASGCYDYFPAALAEVARLSFIGNEKHNPGEPLHHARGKSSDHADAMQRHFQERGYFDEIVLPDGRAFRIRHSAEMAWRALAILQEELEAAGEAPLARGAVVPEREPIEDYIAENAARFSRLKAETRWQQGDDLPTSPPKDRR